MVTHVNSKWRIAAIVLSLVALAQGLELFRIKSKLKNVFYYDVAVTFKDKSTGRILESVTLCYPNESTRDPFQNFVRHGGTPTRSQISGIYYQPREFGFVKEGYKRKNIFFTKDTNWNLTVELEPKNPNAEQGGASDGDKPSN